MDASELLRDARVVPVIVLDDPGEAVRLADVLFGAGLRTIEVTLRTSSALESIEKIAGILPDVVVGAGSVRTAHQFAQIKDAEAHFAVSPGSSALLLEAATSHEMPFVPGAATASEIIRLQEHGYTLTKFFPAEIAGGIPMLKALGSPLPEARFFPTGGITPALAIDYLAQSNVSCIGGSWITPGDLLASRDYKAIAKIAVEAATLGG